MALADRHGDDCDDDVPLWRFNRGHIADLLALYCGNNPGIIAAVERVLHLIDLSSDVESCIENVNLNVVLGRLGFRTFNSLLNGAVRANLDEQGDLDWLSGVNRNGLTVANVDLGGIPKRGDCIQGECGHERREQPLTKSCHFYCAFRLHAVEFYMAGCFHLNPSSITRLRA